MGGRVGVAIGLAVLMGLSGVTGGCGGAPARRLRSAAAYLDLPVAQQPRSLRGAGIPTRTEPPL